jgi:hypothetical protein
MFTGMGRLRVATATVATAGQTRFGEGLVAYHEIHAEAFGGPLPGKLEFTLTLEGDRYVVTSLRLAEGLTNGLLRQIPLATLVRMAIESGTDAIEAGQATPGAWAGKRPALPIGREGPSDDVLAFVAKAYRYAVLCGEPQIEFVREKLHGPSRATVIRWINLARERGFWQPYDEN